MPSVQLGRYRDIAAAVAERLAADPRAEVIVASRGVRLAVLQELLKRSGARAVSVRLDSIDDYAKRLVNDAGEYPRVANDLERRLAMRTAVRSIADPLLESRGVAAMLERSYRDVRDSGLTVAEFASRARGRGRTALLARVWREYERLIEQLGAIDPADLFTRAAALAPKNAIVAGFYDMTGVQRRMVEAIADAEQFVPEARDGEHQEDVSAYSTKSDELRDVCARIAALLRDGVPPRAIGIVARSLDAHDADTIHRAAAMHGFATTAPDEIPLHAHRIGRGVITLLRLRERGFPRRDVFELLRDGLRVSRAIDVDKADLATRTARIAGGTAAELRPLSKRPLVDDYLAVVAELESIVARDWMTFADLFRIETRLDERAAEAIANVVDLFKRAAVWKRPFDANTVIDALEQQVVKQPSNPATQQPLIWAGDIMRMRGRTFTHLFAVNLQDDVFPQRRTDDPLLPDSDRRAIGVREIGDGRDEERLLFQLLRDSADHVHLSFAGGDGFGKTMRPSQFLFGREVTKSRGREEEAAATPRRRDPATRQLQLLVKSGTKSAFDGYLARRDFARTLASVTPTQLEDFGECPQKFLFKHILGAIDVDDPERELQMHHREKGTLLHRILERYYRGGMAAPLDAIVDEEFDRLDRESPPFNRTWRDIERRSTKRSLAQFVAADRAELQAEKLNPQWFEYSFGTKYAARGRVDHAEPFTIETHGVSINIDGRIDRIDSGEEGGLRIVDYKSGKALRHASLDKKIDRGVRLQLALYAMAISKFFGVGAENVRGAIKPLVLSEAKPEKFAFALAEKESRLRETIDLFAASILSGLFPAFPGDDDDDVNGCKYCPVAHSCRTRHDSEERYAVRRFGEPRTLLEGAR